MVHSSWAKHLSRCCCEGVYMWLTFKLVYFKQRGLSSWYIWASSHQMKALRTETEVSQEKAILPQDWRIKILNEFLVWRFKNPDCNLNSSFNFKASELLNILEMSIMWTHSLKYICLSASLFLSLSLCLPHPTHVCLSFSKEPQLIHTLNDFYVPGTESGVMHIAGVLSFINLVWASGNKHIRSWKVL